MWKTYAFLLAFALTPVTTRAMDGCPNPSNQGKIVPENGACGAKTGVCAPGFDCLPKVANAKPLVCVCRTFPNPKVKK